MPRFEPAKDHPLNDLHHLRDIVLAPFLEKELTMTVQSTLRDAGFQSIFIASESSHSCAAVITRIRGKQCSQNTNS